MELKCIIFDSELEFRKYVIQYSTSIQRIIIFEDSLEQFIFFYCFFEDNVIAAAKELSTKNFSSFKSSYIQLVTKLNCNASIHRNKIDVLEFFNA